MAFSKVVRTLLGPSTIPGRLPWSFGNCSRQCRHRKAEGLQLYRTICSICQPTSLTRRTLCQVTRCLCSRRDINLPRNTPKRSRMPSFTNSLRRYTEQQQLHQAKPFNFVFLKSNPTRQRCLANPFLRTVWRFHPKENWSLYNIPSSNQDLARRFSDASLVERTIINQLRDLKSM